MLKSCKQKKLSPFIHFGLKINKEIISIIGCTNCFQNRLIFLCILSYSKNNKKLENHKTNKISAFCTKPKTPLSWWSKIYWKLNPNFSLNTQPVYFNVNLQLLIAGKKIIIVTKNQLQRSQDLHVHNLIGILILAILWKEMNVNILAFKYYFVLE